MKTPTTEQWRKLCEKAGLAVKTQPNFGEDFVEFKDVDVPLSDLPRNTDALMRLMDAVFPTRLIASEPNGSIITAMNSQTRKYECEVEHIDGVEEIRLAACDILAQLAEAEGVK